MITASIVLYNTKKELIEIIMNSIIKSKSIYRLFVIDNSPKPLLYSYFKNFDFVEYIEHENTGYGSSHNIAIKKAITLCANYHIVLNPDIQFTSDVLRELEKYMNKNPDIGYILPKVIYPNGDLQYLCKLLPSPSDLIFRRFLPKFKFIQKKDERYVLKHLDYNKIMNPPCLSGCFMFLRCSTLKENNIFFDDRFFMYFEDFDLIRRIHKVAKTIYFPEVTIIHAHAKESYKSRKMLLVHIKSAIKYFNKWGWFFDKERKLWNEEILKELKQY